MEIRDLKLRNRNARIGIKLIKEEKGVSYTFLAKQMGMSFDSFGHWRTGRYDFSIQKLREVEALIGQYTA